MYHLQQKYKPKEQSSDIPSTTKMETKGTDINFYGWTWRSKTVDRMRFIYSSDAIKCIIMNSVSNVSSLESFSS